MKDHHTMIKAFRVTNFVDKVFLLNLFVDLLVQNFYRPNFPTISSVYFQNVSWLDLKFICLVEQLQSNFREMWKRVIGAEWRGLQKCWGVVPAFGVGLRSGLRLGLWPAGTQA